MTIRTALLESRFLFGDQALYDTLVARFDQEIVATSARRRSSTPSSRSAMRASRRPARRAISSSPT